MRKLKRHNSSGKTKEPDILSMEMEVLPEDEGLLHDLMFDMYDDLVKSPITPVYLKETFENLPKHVSKTGDTNLMKKMCNTFFKIHMYLIYGRHGLLKDDKYHNTSRGIRNIFESIWLEADEKMSAVYDNIKNYPTIYEQYIADIYKNDTENKFSDIYNPATYNGISIYDLKNKDGTLRNDVMEHLRNIWICVKYDSFSKSHREPAAASYNILQNMMREQLTNRASNDIVTEKYYEVQMIIYMARSIRQKDKNFNYYKLYPLCFQENYAHLSASIFYKEVLQSVIKYMGELDNIVTKDNFFTNIKSNSLYKKILKICDIPDKDDSDNTDRYNNLWPHKNMFKLINLIKTEKGYERWRNICDKRHYRCDVILPEYSGPIQRLLHNIYWYTTDKEKYEKAWTEYAARLSFYISENAKRVEEVYKIYKNASYNFNDLNNLYILTLMQHVFTDESEYYK